MRTDRWQTFLPFRMPYDWSIVSGEIESCAVRSMTTSTKWLIGMGAALGVLVVVAVVGALISDGGQPELFAEDIPEGSTQRYVLAMIDGDLDEAWGYLSPELQAGCPLAEWREVARRQSHLEESQILLDEVHWINDTEVTVSLNRRRVSQPDPFDLSFSADESTHHFEDFRLKKQEDNAWRISQLPWPVFRCPEQGLIEPVPAG